MLEHVRWLRHAAEAAGAELIFAGDTLLALLRKEDWHGALYPRFVIARDGSPVFTTQLHDAVDGFGGWLPYPIRPWPLAADRLQLKSTLAAAGLPVPEAIQEARDGLSHVVVKRAARSAESRTEGPFRSASDRPLDAAAGEFYEPFVPGDRLEVWFWNGVPLCGEMRRLPFVLGDGTAQLGELILHRASHSGPRSKEDGDALFARAEAFLGYLGTPLTTVLPQGVRQTVDFRHESPLSHPSDRDTIDLSTAGDTEWMRLLRRTGEVLLANLPEQERAAALFTVELLLDDENRPWLMGASSNPVVHPLVYPAVLASWVPASTRAAADPVQPGPTTSVAGPA
jgi:hypothetical protein